MHAIITFLLSLKNKVLKILGIFFPALYFNGWLEQFGCQTSLIQNLLPQKKIQKHKDCKNIFFLKRSPTRETYYLQKCVKITMSLGQLSVSVKGSRSWKKVFLKFSTKLNIQRNSKRSWNCYWCKDVSVLSLISAMVIIECLLTKRWNVC